MSSVVPRKSKRERFASVLIERQVIIGTSSVILPGVTVAEGCAIGAMTLVVKSTEPWGMYVGSPARWLKARKKDLNELERRFLQDADS